jgi:hypothetical protein
VKPWDGTTERRITSARDHQVVLVGGRAPMLFIGRKRGGGLIASLAWPALLEIADLVEQLRDRRQLQAVQDALRHTFPAQPDAGELRRGALVARRTR